MAIHELKTVQPYFDEVVKETKRFELRRCDDRDFRVGDTLRLREWKRHAEVYTGEEVHAEVLFILRGEDWDPALAGYCIMSIKRTV